MAEQLTGSGAMGQPARDSRLPAELELKRDRLVQVLADYGRVAVALSAGVDSSTVAKAAALACGDSAIGVTADSPSLARGELDLARRLAEQVGLRHVVLPTREFENPDYTRNPANRCYFCKTELYSRLLEMKEQLRFDVIVNGANLDDMGDHRPGMLAAAEQLVRSPLIEAGFRKDDIRLLARWWGLSVWDKPAAPCLSSRVAYGVEVTPARVERIDQAEQFLRETLRVQELRVRLEANELARIEVPLPVVPRLCEATVRDQVTARLLSLGFRSVTVDLQGFRSGSLNAGLAPQDLVRLET